MTDYINIGTTRGCIHCGNSEWLAYKETKIYTETCDKCGGHFFAHRPLNVKIIIK